MKIKIKNLIPFDILASYNECSTEQAVQEAYTKMLNIGDLTNAERSELEGLRAQNNQSIVEIDIELNSKQTALLDKIMMNQSMGDLNSKVFDITLGYLLLTKEAQDVVDKVINK